MLTKYCLIIHHFIQKILFFKTFYLNIYNLVVARFLSQEMMPIWRIFRQLADIGPLEWLNLVLCPTLDFQPFIHSTLPSIFLFLHILSFLRHFHLRPCHLRPCHLRPFHLRPCHLQAFLATPYHLHPFHLSILSFLPILSFLHILPFLPILPSLQPDQNRISSVREFVRSQGFWDTFTAGSRPLFGATKEKPIKWVHNGIFVLSILSVS